MGELIRYGLCESENCNSANKKIAIKEHYVKTKHYMFCKNCLGNMEICSKSKSKKIFHLTDDDIKNVKLIYLENNTTHQFYKYQDIKNVLINKYGSISNLQSVINKKNEIKEIKNKKSESAKLQRELKIRETFQMNKLEFKNYGDVYTFIHYGKPDLNTVVNNELIKINQKNVRRNTLANKLNQLNISIDESLKSCYEYINNIGTKTLDDVVRHIEVEHFLKYNTNYDELCKKYDTKKAKELAIRKYTETENLPKNIKNSYKNIKVEFE